MRIEQDLTLVGVGLEGFLRRREAVAVGDDSLVGDLAGELSQVFSHAHSATPLATSVGGPTRG